MSDLSDNVQSAITAVLQSASIHLDYVGDLQHGYNNDTHQKARSATPGTSDIHVVNNTLDKTTTQQQQQQSDTTGLASTATGLPDPSAVATAIDRVEEDEKKEQGAEDETAVASTAIGLPASDPILDAMKQGGDGGDNNSTRDDDATTKEETAPLVDTLQKAINTVTSSAPATAARNLIDNMAASDSLDGPSPNPSITMKHQTQQQHQPERSCNQVDPSPSSGKTDSNQDIQHITAAPGADSHPTAMKEPTHTVIDDNAKSVMDPTPVEPVVENIVTSIQSVEEPVVEEKMIREPAAAAAERSTLDAHTCPTPADFKTEHLPNVEVRALASDPIVENTDPAGADDEIKVEQVSPSAVTTMAVTAEEEPATVDDIKATVDDDDGRQVVMTTGEPIKKDGTTVVEQDSVEQQVIGAKDDDDDECGAIKDNDHTKLPTPEKTLAMEESQQKATPDTQSRSIESKSLPPQPSHQAPTTGQSQEQQVSPEPNTSKSSKCAIM